MDKDQHQGTCYILGEKSEYKDDGPNFFINHALNDVEDSKSNILPPSDVTYTLS